MRPGLRRPPVARRLAVAVLLFGPTGAAAGAASTGGLVLAADGYVAAGVFVSGMGLLGVAALIMLAIIYGEPR